MNAEHVGLTPGTIRLSRILPDAAMMNVSM